MVEKLTMEVVETIDVTNETESGISQIKAGLRQQMNHAEFRLEDVELIDVTLDIDNYYDGEPIQTIVNATIPAPPEDQDSDEYQDWEQDYVFEHTGTGRTDGDSCYFVTVTKSSRPDLIPVGTEYEFGT